MAVEALLRIGVVVSDPMRVEGFLALFSHMAEVLPMLPTDAVRRQDLSMVIIDSEEQLFPMLAAFRRARPNLRILVLGTSNDPHFISRVVAAGAKGYLTHLTTSVEIETAIRVVADGSIWAPRKVLSSLIDTLSPGEPVRSNLRFTPREFELLALLVQGHPDRIIAEKMGISVRTVQGMVRELLQRVGVKNRVALTVYVMERQILDV